MCIILTGRVSFTAGRIEGKTIPRRAMLDTLHRSGIEIVSPGFVNRRLVEEGQRFIPSREKPPESKQARSESASSVEELAFDRAEAAESLEKLKEKYTAVVEALGELEGRVKEADDEASREQLEKRQAILEKRSEILEAHIEKRQKKD